MCARTLGEGRIAKRSADPFHPAGKPAASLLGVSKRLRLHAYRDAPHGLVREASHA
jgi:hypothetical protein